MARIAKNIKGRRVVIFTEGAGHWSFKFPALMKTSCCGRGAHIEESIDMIDYSNLMNLIEKMGLRTYGQYWTR